MKGLGSIMLSNVCIMILSEWSRPSLQNYVLTDIGLTAIYPILKKGTDSVIKESIS